jgi:hypothetical protein
MAGFIGFVVGLLAVIVFAVAGAPLATRRIASSSAFGLRTADTDGDDQIWHLANAAIGRDLLAIAGIDLILTAVALVYWGEDAVQSALTVSILLISIAGVIVAITRGVINARSLGKAKQAFPPGTRRFQS